MYIPLKHCSNGSILSEQYFATNAYMHMQMHTYLVPEVHTYVKERWTIYFAANAYAYYAHVLYSTGGSHGIAR